MSDMCAGCAFRKGCETWHEVENRVTSQLCVSGPIPFACHHGLDWDSVLASALPVQALVPAGERLHICEGWRRAVRERVWPTDPALRLYQRWLAAEALIAFRKFRDGEISARELQRNLSPLDRYYRGPRAWQIARMVQRWI
jgi:hypothetical protein